MRRGFVSARNVKCIKPGCPCAQDANARHGPYYGLTRAVSGKTHSRFLTPEQAMIAGQQIGAGSEFRNKLEVYWKSCETWQTPNWPPTRRGGPKRRVSADLQNEIVQEIEALLGRQAVRDLELAESEIFEVRPSKCSLFDAAAGTLSGHQVNLICQRADELPIRVCVQTVAERTGDEYS